MNVICILQESTHAAAMAFYMVLMLLTMHFAHIHSVPSLLQAFLLFEESIPDSAAERTALASIVGALHGCRIFSAESRSTLVHKATGYSAKLLRRGDQCRAVLACSHLHWQARLMHTNAALTCVYV